MKLTDSLNSILPKGIKRGDTIGITAPSSQINMKGVSHFAYYLKKKGYNVKFGDLIWMVRDRDYNSGSANERADDLNALIRNPDVRCIFAGAGGFGAQMTAEYIDYAALIKDPKPIIGFSDTTYLLNAIYLRTNMVTFLGPTAEFYSVEQDEKCIDNCLDIITGNIDYPSVVENIDHTFIRRISSKSVGIGRIVGGNFTMMQTSIGTDFEVDTDGKIILIEERGESSYSVERTLDHMFTAGKFNNPAAIVIGEFSDILREPVTTAHDGNPSIYEVLVKKFKGADYPVLVGYNFSHGKYNLTLPIGGLGKVDARDNTFTLLEDNVR